MPRWASGRSRRTRAGSSRSLLHRAEATGAPEYRYLRGGFWRTFAVKYREVNDLHKQMLRTSAKVAAMPEGPARSAALNHLHQGQSNDCYWHGLFGGIYISHMRLATYEHLIGAEDAADMAARVAGRVVDGVREEDVDLDGVAEVVLATAGQVVTVKPSEGAGIGGWDIRAVRHALTAVLRRRPEASHATLVAHEQRRSAEDSAVAGAGDDGTTGAGDADATGAVGADAGSIHDRVAAKEPGLADLLHYDAYERRSGLVHLLAPATTPGAFARAEAEEYGDFVAGPFAVEATGANGETGAVDDTAGGAAHGAAAWVGLVRDGVAGTPAGALPVRVAKTITVGGDRRTPTLELEVRVENLGRGPLEATLAVEWATTMLGGGGNPAAWYVLDGERIAHDSVARHPSLGALRSGNDYVGLEIATRIEPAAETWISPIDTVSNSEAGFERVYQGSALVFAWPVVLPPGGSTTVRVTHTVATSRDRAVEEGLRGAR